MRDFELEPRKLDTLRFLILIINVCCLEKKKTKNSIKQEKMFSEHY